MAKDKGSKEFEQSVYVGSLAGEPGQTDMGASRINYGEQRFGVGVTSDEPRTYAEPGSEGEIAVGLMKASGGISSSEHFEGESQGTPTGK